MPWTTPGEEIYAFSHFSITRQGLDLAILVTLKANAIILVFLAIMAGMTPMTLGLAFAQMKISHKLALMLVFSGTNIEILHRQWKILREGVALRGFSGNYSFHAWKTFGAMLAFLLVRASDKADRLHEALLLKSFTGKFPLCCPWRLHRTDYLLAFFTFLGIFIFTSLDFYLYAH